MTRVTLEWNPTFTVLVPSFGVWSWANNTCQSSTMLKSLVIRMTLSQCYEKRFTPTLRSDFGPRPNLPRLLPRSPATPIVLQYWLPFGLLPTDNLQFAFALFFCKRSRRIELELCCRFFLDVCVDGA